MVLMVDTTAKHIGKAISEELLRSGKNAAKFELIDTAGMHISHCVGCNYCWLKTPGVCAIQDDYEPILRKINEADQVWLISDTHFGFVSWQTKNIIDRIMRYWDHLHRGRRPGLSRTMVPAYCSESGEPFTGRLL